MTYPTQRFLRGFPAALALVLAAGAVQAQQASDQVAPAAPAMSSQDSSDHNVPPATARKQAAEIAAGDPPRWSREDVTPAQRLRTIQKETAAGLQEAQGNCRRLPTAERASCLKQARTIYQKEMAEARTRANGPAH